MQQLEHLPHIQNVTAGKDKWDPVHNSIFEVTFTAPPKLAGSNETNGDDTINGLFNSQNIAILREQVISVSGLDALQKIAAAGQQKFLGVDVSFLNPTLDSTTAEFTIVFNLNLNPKADKNYDALVLRLFKEWGKLSYNIATGHRALKKDYTCDTLTIAQANRDGIVWRQITFRDVFITGMSGLDSLDYSSSEAVTLSVTFRADYWDEDLNGLDWKLDRE
jgi:hypothetical protein